MSQERSQSGTLWSASMITPATQLDSAPRLRTAFGLAEGHGEVRAAAWRATARGVFEARLNGRPVSPDVLSPGWSSYEWRLRYRTDDVTDLVRVGENGLEVLLGNGWYRGRLGWTGKAGLYGDELGLLAELEITFDDGYVQTVGTDESWSAEGSDVLADDLYDGQTIDARRRLASPTAGPVRAVTDLDVATVVPAIGPPVRRITELAPTRIWTSPSGRTLVDFGQNLVGWVRARISGPAGTVVTIRHAEVLEHDELGVRPLRSAEATDRFVLSGGEDAFEPTLTFHGFRYAEIDGWPGQLMADDLRAVVVSSDLRRIGEFACSHDLLNQFHANVVWGTRGNFLDVPTDCPQRDERLGWTGDIAAFAPSAAYLFDVEDFLRDWLADLAVEQRAAGGRVGSVIPDILKFPDLSGDLPVDHDATAIWSDAAVWVPWALYQAYGDQRVLRDQYDSMAAHVRRVESLLSPTGLWDTGFQFGDWLDPTAPPDNPIEAKADSGVVATACLVRSARIVAQTARILGQEADAAAFGELADRTRAAFGAHYLESDGRIHSDAPTVYALAIVFGLLDEPRRQQAGDRLAELVRAGGHHIQTGFAGTPFVTDALAGTGHLDDAYRLLLQTECPSWLYPVTMGATTIWERWDSMLPDGSINPGAMTSFNHYALGAVADWLHRTVGGIAPLEAGYRRVSIAPKPGGGLTWATSSLETPHGRVAVEWRLDEGGMRLGVTLPAGVEAVVALPDGTEHVVAAASGEVQPLEFRST